MTDTIKYRCTRCSKESEYKSTLKCGRCLDDIGPRLREESKEVLRLGGDDVALVSAEFRSELLN